MDLQKPIPKFLYHLFLSVIAGVVLAIVSVFLQAIWDGISSFSSKMAETQLENAVRAHAMEKVFVEKISELKVRLASIEEKLTVEGPLYPVVAEENREEAGYSNIRQEIQQQLNQEYENFKK